MSYAPPTVARSEVKGSFVEKDFGHYFEYVDTTDSPWVGHDKKVFVGDTHRFAKVLKTVAYIVIDESADGSPVVEKWHIKKHVKRI